MNNQKPRRKPAACNSNHVYSKLLYYLQFIQYPERGNGWDNLHWQSYAVAYYLEARAKAQHKPHTCLDGAVLVYSTLNGLLSGEDWESMKERLYRDKGITNFRA